MLFFSNQIAFTEKRLTFSSSNIFPEPPNVNTKYTHWSEFLLIICPIYRLPVQEVKNMKCSNQLSVFALNGAMEQKRTSTHHAVAQIGAIEK